MKTIFALAVAATVVVAGLWFGRDRIAMHLRHAEVASRGVLVMPFDLEQTTHLFKKTGDGGVQRVITTDSANESQVVLIRKHLQREAKKFQRGDFSSPTEIHGHEMPGLTALSTNASRLDVHYSDFPNGGQIIYTTRDPALLNALHRWFDAQLYDHGSHATDH